MQELTNWFMIASEDAQFGARYGAVAAGFVLAMILRRNAPMRLRRAPYFMAIMGIRAAAAAAFYALPPFAMQARISDTLEIYTCVYIALLIALGFVYGVACVARSKDAFDSTGWSFFGLLPITNFSLIFSRTRQRPTDDFVTSSPIPYIVGGVLFLSLTGMTDRAGERSAPYAFDQTGERRAPYALDQAGERRAPDALDQRPADELSDVAILQAAIDRFGLEAVLALEARAAPIQQRGPGIWLLGAQAEGRVLRFNYSLPPGTRLSETTMRANTCAHPPARLLLSEGATIAHAVVAPQASRSEIVVTESDCR